MKKIFVLLFALLFVLAPTFASEASVVVSTLVPAYLYGFSMEEERIDLSSYDPDYLEPLALPFIVEESGFSLLDVTSYDPERIVKAFWDASKIYVDLSDLEIISASGTVTVSPYLDIDSAEAGFSVSFDDVNLLYSANSWVDVATLNGKTSAKIELSTDDLFVISVSSDNTLAGKGSVELAVALNRDKMEAFLKANKTDLVEYRGYLFKLIAESEPELVNSVFGSDGISAEEVQEILENRKMMDVVDLITVLFYAYSNPYDDVELLDVLTISLKPMLTIDGDSANSIDVAKFAKDAFRVYSLIGMYF